MTATQMGDMTGDQLDMDARVESSYPHEIEPPYLWCSGCGAKMAEGEPHHKNTDPGHSGYRLSSGREYNPCACPCHEADTEELARLREALVSALQEAAEAEARAYTVDPPPVVGTWGDRIIEALARHGLRVVPHPVQHTEECGHEVNLTEVAYGNQYDPCRKPKGHDGNHDPSAVQHTGELREGLDAMRNRVERYAKESPFVGWRGLSIPDVLALLDDAESRGGHSADCIAAHYSDGGQTGCICGGDDR